MSISVKSILLAGLCVCVWAGQAAAVDVVRLDQTKVRLRIKPGQAHTGRIMVENPSEEPKMVRMYLEDWNYIPPFDGAKEFKPPSTSRYSCADWITVNPGEVALGPYDRKPINFTVKVPEDASGARYSVLFFETSMGKPDSEGVGVSVAVRVATLFYVEVDGTVEKKAEFSNFSAQRTDRSKPLTLSLEMKNTGGLDITAGGTFSVIDSKGMVFARGEFSNVYTFPGDSGRMTASWNPPLEKGVYDLILTLNLNKAEEEAGWPRGKAVVKETTIEIGESGQLVRAGALP